MGSSAMVDVTLHLELTVISGDSAISGKIAGDPAEAVEFVGWLGLMSAIDAMRACTTHRDNIATRDVPAPPPQRSHRARTP